jgi:3-deoxy-D-arabino-heptulosonate 7-phosphate (DAHP) synthase
MGGGLLSALAVLSKVCCAFYECKHLPLVISLCSQVRLSAYVRPLFQITTAVGATRTGAEVHGAPAAARGPLPVLV